MLFRDFEADAQEATARIAFRHWNGNDAVAWDEDGSSIDERKEAEGAPGSSAPSAARRPAYFALQGMPRSHPPPA